MTQLNIFLGSSKELMYLRKKIGNLIRVLNDTWYDKGVYVRLRIWENFRTEYEDKSKQEEYIEELVLPSQICIFLYADALNPYTERELDAKAVQDKSAIHLFHVPDKDGVWHKAKDVLGRIQAKKLLSINKKDIDTLMLDISQIVEDYIVKNNLADGKAGCMECKNLYTTIPSDMEHDEDGFSDAIRDINDISIEYLSTRCLLFPRKHIDLLNETDHYIPLMRKKTGDEDLAEFKMALDLQHASKDNRPAITLFSKGAIYKKENNAQMAALLEGKDLFNVSVYSGWDTVKWRLFSWLLSQKHFIASVGLSGFQFHDKYLYYQERPIAEIDTIDTTGETSKILANIHALGADIETQVTAPTANSAHIVAEKTAEIEFEKARLQINMIRVINKWLYEEIRVPHDFVETIEVGNFDNATKLEGEMLKNALQQAAEIRDNWQEELKKLQSSADKLRDQLNATTNEDACRQIATQLKEAMLKEESIFRELAKNGLDSPERLFSTQMYMVGLYDTYIKSFIQPEEEDQLYQRIFTDAEAFGYRSAYVEMARMNYANALNRQEKDEDALKLYMQVVSNLKEYDDSDKFIRKMIVHAYILAVHSLMDDNRHSEPLAILMSELRDKVMKWSREDSDFLIDECMYHAANIRFATGSFEETWPIVNDAISAYEAARQSCTLTPDNDYYSDVFCYLPIMIAGYYLDRWNEIHPGLQAMIITRCIQLCREAIAYADKIGGKGQIIGMTQKSKAYHQLGFLGAKLAPSFWISASEHYWQALLLREKIYALSNVSRDELDIAETSVNFGALVLQIMQHGVTKDMAGNRKEFAIPEPLAIAERAIDIYSRHLVEGSEESELNLYKAIQLKGSMLFCLFKDRQEEAIELLKQASDWNVAHPGNSYQDVFEGVADVILSQVEELRNKGGNDGK